MISYLDIIATHFAGTAVSNYGNPSVYEDITWHDAPIPKASLDAFVLEELKKIRISEIDKKTGEFITAGFTYSGYQFSLSGLAQTNWIGLKQSDQNSFITYPFAISTIDDGEYLLTNSADVTSFYLAGLGAKINHLGSGRALKLLIKAAADETALNAIVDNR